MIDRPMPTLTIKDIERYSKAWESFQGRQESWPTESGVDERVVFNQVLRGFTSSQFPRFLPVADTFRSYDPNVNTTSLDRAYYGNPLTSPDVEVETAGGMSYRGSPSIVLRSHAEDSLQVMRRLLVEKEGDRSLVDVYSDHINPVYVPLPKRFKNSGIKGIASQETPQGMEVNFRTLQYYELLKIMEYAERFTPIILCSLPLEELKDFRNKKVPTLPQFKLG